MIKADSSMKNKKSKNKKNKDSIKKIVKSVNADKMKEYIILSEIFDKPKGLKRRWW